VHGDVVVDEHQELGVRRGDGAVARGVEPARRVMGDVAHAVPGGHGPRGGPRAVVDHGDPHAAGSGLRADRRQRYVEVARAVARGDDDLGGGRHLGAQG
jgi:hypothetical protein